MTNLLAQYAENKEVYVNGFEIAPAERFWARIKKRTDLAESLHNWQRTVPVHVCSASLASVQLEELIVP